MCSCGKPKKLRQGRKGEYFKRCSQSCDGVPKVNPAPKAVQPTHAPWKHNSRCACGNAKQLKSDGTYWERCGRHCNGNPNWKYNPACACTNKKNRQNIDGTYAYEHCSKACALKYKSSAPTTRAPVPTVTPAASYPHSGPLRQYTRKMTWGVFPESSYKRKPDPVLPEDDLKKVVAMIESLVCVSRPRCRGLCVCWNGYRPVVPDNWNLKIRPDYNQGCVAYSVCFTSWMGGRKMETVCTVKPIGR